MHAHMCNIATAISAYPPQSFQDYNMDTKIMVLGFIMRGLPSHWLKKDRNLFM